MKDKISNVRVIPMHLSAVTAAAGANKVCTEVDIGSARNATVVVVYAGAAAASDLDNIDFFSNHASSVVSSGSAGASSDLVTITQDTENNTSDVTISSNVIATIKSGYYTFFLKDLRRYLNMQYDSTGAGSYLTVVVFAYDAMKQPYDSDLMDPTY